MEDINPSDRSASPRRSRSNSRHRSTDSTSSTSPRHVKSLLLAMLKMKTFIGQFTATIRVDQLGQYRDVIQIEARDPLVPIITELQMRIYQAFPNSWPGVTKPGDLAVQDGHCFWVENADKLFEPHHYRITDIQFTKNEICFIIKTEGKVVPEMSANEKSIYEVLSTSKEVIQAQSKLFAVGMWELLTVENIKNTLRFLGALITLLGTAGVYLLDYLIRLIHALTGLLKVSMPAVMKCLDILQKVIGAIFVFFAMVWRDLMGTSRGAYYHDRPRPIRYR